MDQGRSLGQRGDLRVAPGDHPRLLLARGLALVQPGAELARQRRGPVPLLGQPSIVRLQLSRPVLDRRVRRLRLGRLHLQVGKPSSKLLCFRRDLAEPRLQARPVAGHLITVLLGPTRGTAEDGPDLLPDRVPSRNIGQSMAGSPAPGRDADCEVEGLGGEQDVRIIQSIDQRGPMAVKLGVDEILDRRRDGGLFERVRPAKEPCEPRHLLAMRVNQILIKDEVPWETGGLLDRRPRVDLPQSDRLLDRETVSFLQ